MKRPLEIDYSNSRYFAKSDAKEPVVSVEEEQEVLGIIWGPNGNALKYMVANPKLPIGYMKEPK